MPAWLALRHTLSFGLCWRRVMMIGGCNRQHGSMAARMPRTFDRWLSGVSLLSYPWAIFPIDCANSFCAFPSPRPPPHVRSACAGLGRHAASLSSHFTVMSDASDMPTHAADDQLPASLVPTCGGSTTGVLFTSSARSVALASPKSIQPWSALGQSWAVGWEKLVGSDRYASVTMTAGTRCSGDMLAWIGFPLGMDGTPSTCCSRRLQGFREGTRLQRDLNGSVGRWEPPTVLYCTPPERRAVRAT
nr:hypothetical protein CFP56_04351 [Quercus suber]